MMRNVAGTVVLGALGLSLSLAQPVPDRAPAPDGGRDRHRMHEAMRAELNLTAQQETQIQKLRFEMEKKQTAVQAKIRLARIDIKEIFAAENPDRNAVEKKMKEVSDLQLQEKLAWLDHVFAVKAILTPEQQKIWKEHMKEMGPEMRGEMMQRMMGRKMRPREE